MNLSSITNMDTAVTQFNTIIQEADKKHILKGNRKQHNWNFTPEIAHLIRERNNLRRTPTPHSPATTQLIQELNTQIRVKITQKQQETWQEFLDTLDHSTNTAKLYSTIRSINNSNSKQDPTHAAITNNSYNKASRQK